MASQTHSSLPAGLVLFVLDAVLVATGWPLTVLPVSPGIPASGWAGLLPSLIYPAFYLLFLYALGLYRRGALLETRQSLRRAPLAAVLGAMTAWAVVAILPSPLGSFGEAEMFVSAVACFVVAGFVSRVALLALRRRRAFRRRVLVIGAGRRAWEMNWLLRKEGRRLAYEITFVHDPATGKVDSQLAEDPSSRIVEAGAGLLAVAREIDAEQIVVALDDRRGMAMEGLLACRTAGFPLSEYPRFLEKEIGRIDLKRLDLGWLLYSDGFTVGLISRVLKRVLDVSVSLLMLLLALPFMLPIALVMKLTDRGPVLYRQARVTQQGRVFHILKLRTMTVNAERHGAVWAQERDPRITRIGRFLRRTRLDEVPQLINVLAGDMSFVGPRPERPEFTRELVAKLPLYDERHVVKAGLTGWAQVNYPYGASLDDARSKLSYDLYYVKNFNILFDLLIIAQTLRVVFWPGGVR